MKGLACAAVIALATAVGVARAGQSPVIQVEFTDDQLDPSHWTLTFNPDGNGHFSSEAGKPPDGTPPQVDAPNVDRDIQLSADFASHVFEMAHRKKLFNMQCDGRLKVAFQGWKKFSYTGEDGTGSCTFNYSKDKEMQELGESVQAVAETIIEGARLEKLLQHDRLGLDREMEYLVDAADTGRAQQICTIRQILVKLADDDEVLERVRKRARILLSQAGT
jgi:hypothetical protein